MTVIGCENMRLLCWGLLYLKGHLFRRQDMHHRQVCAIHKHDLLLLSVSRFLTAGGSVSQLLVVYLL